MRGNVGIIHYELHSLNRCKNHWCKYTVRCAEADEQVEEADKQAQDGSRMAAGWQGI